MSEQAETRGGGFELNGPTVVALLYLATWLTLISPVLGVILAYASRRHAVPEWQRSQFGYLIRTFWLGVAGYVAAGATGLVGAALGEQGRLSSRTAGEMLLLGVAAMFLWSGLLLLRCARAIVAAQQRVSMTRRWWGLV